MGSFSRSGSEHTLECMPWARPSTCLLVALLLAACGRDAPRTVQAALQPDAPAVWPPRLGEPYPDLHLVDQTGHVTALSSFKGRVLLVEMIGMTCPACQGFSGAKHRGTFGGVTSDGGLPSIDDLLPQYADGVGLPREDLVLVQILLFDMSMGAPTRRRIWTSTRSSSST